MQSSSSSGRSRVASSLLLLACVSAVAAACGGGSTADESTNEGGGSSTAAGSAGAAGKAGSAGTAGKGGSAGGAGATGGSAGATGGSAGATGGSAGAAGTAGKAGASGSGGASGSAGTSGGGGAAGKAGAAGSAGTSGNGGNAGNAGKAGAAGSAGSAGMATAIGLVVTPPQASIDIKNGVPTPTQVQLTAKPVYSNGTVGTPVGDATWKLVPGDRANVDSTGLVKPTGTLGGDVNVTATWKGLSADALVSIHLTETTDDGSLTPGDKTALDGATTQDSATWIYPYDGTVFPRGLLAPEMMWNGFGAGDKMLVSFTSSSVTIKAYFKPTGALYVLPPDLWTKLTESGKGGPVEVRVARIPNGQSTAFQIMKHTWRIASGSMRGTVYYWSNNLGRVVRIKPGASAPDDFLAAAGVTQGCTTCHTVSANGNVLTLGGEQSAGDSPVSVFDLLQSKPVASNYTRRWAMPALTPNGKVAALNNAPLPGGPGLNGGLYDVGTSAKINGTGADNVLFDMPAFAPDGSKLVFVDHNTHALAMYSYAEPGGQPTLSGFTKLVDPVGAPIAFPSVSPDGKLAVYHHGPLDTRDGQADLWLASATTPGAEVALDALNGKTYPFWQGDRDRHYNYEPTFAPVAAGGYFWVVFTSRRTYGNKLLAPAQGGCPNVVKQLWIAAVDITPTPGKDPSYPAFRVPGQSNDCNMRGFWALDPCKDDGVTCGKSSECCGGACLATGVCGEPPGQTCKPVGSTCTKAADCCFADQGFQCINNHCTESKP